MSGISVQGAKNKFDDGELTIIDVRSKKEFDEKHIPGAINIDINSSDFEERIAELKTDKAYATHCNAGGRGRRAAKYMREQGFENAKNLDGGLVAWETNNYPTE